MKLLKKVLAGVSAIAMFANPSTIGCYTVFAEYESKTTIMETTTTTTESSSKKTELSTTESTATESTSESTEITTQTETTTESITTEEENPVYESVEKLPAPSIRINVPDKWVNNTEEWTVETDEGVTVYYELSESDFPDAMELPENIPEWDGGANLPEGSYNIRFWAVHPDGNHINIVSNPWHYQIDRTSPSEFSLNIEEKTDRNSKSLVISNDVPITENDSGIKEIYYTINGKRISDIDFTIDEGKINFSFEIKESLKDAEIAVYVVDNAENFQYSLINAGNFDAKSPEIKNVQIVNISYKESDTEHKNPIENVQESHAYGDEESESYTDYIYASDSSYLKVLIDDDYIDLKIKVTIGENEFEYSAEDIIRVNDKISKNGEYYIPFSEFEMNQSENYEISVTAEDSKSTSETVTLNNHVFYDPVDDADNAVIISYNGEYISCEDSEFEKLALNSDYDLYFSRFNTKAVSVSVSDDVGLASYEIKVNDETVKFENFINIENNQDKVTSPKDYIISLEKDGEYKIEVIVIDLAGNTIKETRMICVDTSSPEITDLKCKIVNKDTFLHYVTFGIYGNKSISLKLKVNDDLSGVQSIQLYWDSDKPYDAVYNENTGYYIFEKLPTGRKAQPYIKICDKLNHETTYYFGSSEENKIDNIVCLTTEIQKNNICLILESEAPQFIVKASGNYNNKSEDIYFGVPKEGISNNIFVQISDNEGIDKYQIKILDCTGKNEIYTGEVHDLLTGAKKAILADKSEKINLDEVESGEYRLCVEAIDIAGNKIEDANKYTTFYVDKDAPEIDDVNYEVTPDILQYFTFGIFGKDTISISVNVNDGGCGVKEVSLYWAKQNSEEVVKYSPTNINNEKYQFSGLSPYGKAIPYIEITDNLDNTSKYYFTTKQQSGNKTIGELILESELSSDEQKAILVLEDDTPIVQLYVPETYKKYEVNGETWYSEEIEYYVAAQDDNSGLNRIIIQENDEKKNTANSFDEIQQLEKIENSYTVDEGKYFINVQAFDNAENESSDNISFNIDTTNPEIIGFQFGGQYGDIFSEETDTYGFYFKEQTEARVYVNDSKVTSGFKNVTLFLSNVDGTFANTTVSGTDLYTDENGTYASFMIPVGFKGKVTSEVVDNVEHSSGVVNTDGNIVEDETIHNVTSLIDIHEEIETDKTDAENIPLYNESIPLKVTVNDSFSGISTIEWSVANDNKHGIISVDNKGNYSSDSQAVTIGEIQTDKNLITSMQFVLSVDSNTNGNVINIKLTDRSGNTSEIFRTYSIDTTNPVISTSFENTDVQNDSYYKAEQKVNVTIIERNFDGNEVQILLNGVKQEVTWDNNGSAVGDDSTKHYASFTISDDGNYFYEISCTDRAGNSAETFISSQFTIDTQKPTAKFSFDGNYNTLLGKSDEELYFGVQKNGKSNVFIVTAEDTSGLDYYQVSIVDSNGNSRYGRVYNSLDKASIHESEKIDLNEIGLESGKYTIYANVVDLAGNAIDENENHMTFYVDVDAPEIENNEYKVVDSILKYFTFGIFGKEKLSILIDVKDNETGCGIENVSLFWAGKDSDNLIQYFPTGIVDGRYTFTELPVNCEAVPYIEVVDYMGNKNTYYFTTVESGSEEKNIGKLALNEETDIILALEDILPEVDVTIPETYKKYTVNGEIWYSGDIEYGITAIDKQSGLNRINIQENDKQIELISKDDVKFVSTRYCDKTEYIYQVAQADNYYVNVYAVDNAGNKTEDKSILFHIDKENPQIRMFQFGGENDNASDIEKTTYGFYFMNETEAKVYINDPGVTSGFKSITLFLENIDGTSANTTVSGTDLYTDENGTYVSFMIPMGFKGKVMAEAIDNVEHSSGVVNADGNIIENEDIHSRTSSIDIHEEIETDRTDAENIPLYNSSIPLTITLNDSFSGISTVEWSISNDEESEVISIDNNGNPDSQAVTILATESNLVTSMQFGISVDSNTNRNVVNIKLTDRSGNTTEVSRTYSIDTTVPVIEASLSNNASHNGSYYTGSQTVNISITERNFNGSDVQITLNGSEQSVTWEDSSSNIGDDLTVHYGSFEVTADGNYTYEINYTDRAGNSADTVTSSQFTIDNTVPTADISFDFGDVNLENAYYNKPRTATLTINEHNYYDAKITVKKDGVDVSKDYELDNWNPQSHSGDNHIQNITFNKNGYYEISVDVTDMAGNTIKETSKGFFIDNDKPVVSVSVENIANGAASNDEIIEPFVSVHDKEGNLDPKTITLKVTAIKLNEKHEIVSDIQNYVGLEKWKKAPVGSIELDNEQNPNLITFSFDNLKDDGIYTFEVTASDKAGNTGGVSEEDQEKGAKYKISVNRLGSTYEIDAKVAEVEPDLRYFRNQKDNPFSFIITEYNVSQLEKNKTIVKMTRDGTVVENYITATEETASDKWNVYTYEFPAELMEVSGKYIVKLYSVDEAGNENPVLVNDEDEQATVTFFIDNDAPILYFRDADDKTEFTGEESYRTDSKRIEVEVYDNSQQEVRNVVFKLDGVDLDEQVKHEDGTMIYTFEVASKSSVQNLSVSLEDIAGNRIDGRIDNFLITTDFFVLWLNNTPLLILSVVIALIIVAVLCIVLRKKKHKTRS